MYRDHHLRTLVMAVRATLSIHGHIIYPEHALNGEWNLMSSFGYRKTTTLIYALLKVDEPTPTGKYRCCHTDGKSNTNPIKNQIFSLNSIYSNTVFSFFGTFLDKKSKKIGKNVVGIKKAPYLCTRKKVAGTVFRIGSLGEWLKPAVC